MANELFSTFEKERMDSKTERGETLVPLNMNVCERKNFDPIEWWDDFRSDYEEVNKSIKKWMRIRRERTKSLLVSFKWFKR